MRILRSRGAAALIGAASWTATEYGLHRFLMHELRGRGLASVEHLKHHADVTYFSPASKKVASAAATTAVAYPVTAAVAGLARTAFSNYARLRSTLGLKQYSEQTMIGRLAEVGFKAERAARNIGHNPARMTFVARPN